MGSNPSRFKGANNPVDGVNWEDGHAFIAKLNQYALQQRPRLVEGLFRLPTEAEWEYACRAGTTSALPSGKDLAMAEGADANVDALAWYSGNSEAKTHPVGQKAPNGWGLYDMPGNVWEWCEDWHASQYPAGSQRDPRGPSSGTCRVFRGGAWDCGPGSERSAHRWRDTPDHRSESQGFRLCLTATAPESHAP